MEAALETVERHCPTELSAYVDCVDSNPGSWHAACNELKQLLSACAAKQCATHCHLPTLSPPPTQAPRCARSSPVNTVKDRCKPQIEQYERCLKANASSPDTCTVQLTKLFECSNIQQGAEPAHIGIASHPAGCSCGQHDGTAATT